MQKKQKSKKCVIIRGMGFCIYSTILFLFCGCMKEPELVLSQSENVLEENESIVESVDSEPRLIAESLESESSSEQICVYVCGAVQKPGVYLVSNESRVFEVVEKAGGLLDNSSQIAINLADHVIDGQQIYIPTKEEEDIFLQTNDSSKSVPCKENGLININTASNEELQRLTGIGDRKANEIISYREKNGEFRSVEEIKKVTGIGDGIFLKIKDKITV